MRYWLIADSSQALEGMRLAGVKGELVSDAAEAKAAVRRACADPSVAVLLVTRGVEEMISDTVDALKLSGQRPLVGVVPGPGGEGLGPEAITGLIRKAIGVKIE